jgi:NTE family protein
MPAEKFTQRAEIHHLIEKLKADCGQKIYSDVIDAEGHQYVDLVMEGGGVLGAALVGYTYILEEMGLRFWGIGGTSAGSINALLLAALGLPAERKSEKIAQLLGELDLHSFVDGDSDAREFIRAYLSRAGKFKLAFRVLQILDNLENELGLNPGQAFQDYITGVLKEAGITTTQKLNQRMATLPPGLTLREGDPAKLAGATPRLGIVAADISTETKVVFPEMAKLYWADPDSVNPALYVRASMSIPYFFQPFKIENVPNNEAAWDNWNKLVSYTEEPPKTAILVDGGIMSNFPIDLFHRTDGIPTRPTFGVKLGSDKRSKPQIAGPAQLGAAVFNAARHCLDYDFVVRNPDYRQLVAYVSTDNHDWLNFEMKEEERIDLFTQGALAAADFLRRFNWAKYKKLRKQLIHK